MTNVTFAKKKKCVLNESYAAGLINLCQAVLWRFEDLILDGISSHILTQILYVCITFHYNHSSAVKLTDCYKRESLVGSTLFALSINSSYKRH